MDFVIHFYSVPESIELYEPVVDRDVAHKVECLPSIPKQWEECVRERQRERKSEEREKARIRPVICERAQQTWRIREKQP